MKKFLKAVKDLCCGCCASEDQESGFLRRPLIPKDDKEGKIRKDVITKLLRLSVIGIDETEIKLNDKEKKITQKLKRREDEFTDKEKYSVFCGTWNVNGENPPDSLQMWFDKVGIEDERRKTPPDIIVIGLQEVGETFSWCSGKAQEWNQALKSSFPKHRNYSLIEMVCMLRIVMFVYVEDSLMAILSTTDISKVPTGILGIMGNKGGVGIRMDIHDTSLCFINSHLAAKQMRCKRRNEDYRDVDRKMRFKKTPTLCKIRDHEIIFWIGDLNYRINDTIEQVKRKIEGKEYKDLLQNDQLFLQMKLAAAFEGYIEEDIDFNPTYKYNNGSNEWDSKKNRIPAWCDRILYKGDMEDIEVDHYTSHPDILFSDHMPVSSLFRIAVKKIDKRRYDNIYKEVVSEISGSTVPPNYGLTATETDTILTSVTE